MPLKTNIWVKWTSETDSEFWLFFPHISDFNLRTLTFLFRPKNKYVKETNLRGKIEMKGWIITKNFKEKNIKTLYVHILYTCTLLTCDLNGLQWAVSSESSAFLYSLTADKI